MKVKAIILALVFLLGGSGLSVDIAKCCSRLTGFSISLGQHHKVDQDCGACVETEKKSCCEDVVIHTVINSVQGLTKAFSSVSKAPLARISPAPEQKAVKLPAYARLASTYDAFDHQYPVPILIQKRVLQI